MKTVLLAAVTADGFIARHATHTADWTSKEDKQHFARVTKEMGTMVVGSTTFDTIGRPLSGRRMIVMTRRPEKYQREGIETFTGTAEQLHTMLEAGDTAGLAVIGGAEIYGQFLKAGLVDELILTVEPQLFGQGISLSSAGLDVALTLVSIERLGENAVVLHYKVER